MMAKSILLDTNVLSELMRPRPDVQVMAWFERKHDTQFYTSSVTKAEILLGIALLPAGNRQTRLAEAAIAMFSEEFLGYCLPFDENSAEIYAELVAERKRTGQPISTEDAQIASITLSNHLCLATRNGKDFSGISGLIVINPWDAP